MLFRSTRSVVRRSCPCHLMSIGTRSTFNFKAQVNFQNVQPFNNYLPLHCRHTLRLLHSYCLYHALRVVWCSLGSGRSDHLALRRRSPRLASYSIDLHLRRAKQGVAVACSHRSAALKWVDGRAGPQVTAVRSAVRHRSSLKCHQKTRKLRRTNERTRGRVVNVHQQRGPFEVTPPFRLRPRRRSTFDAGC